MAKELFAYGLCALVMSIFEGNNGRTCTWMQGIVSVSRLRQARDASERAEVVQEALGPLFQAAAGLRPRCSSLCSPAY